MLVIGLIFCRNTTRYIWAVIDVAAYINVYVSSPLIPTADDSSRLEHRPTTFRASRPTIGNSKKHQSLYKIGKVVQYKLLVSATHIAIDRGISQP